MGIAFRSLKGNGDEPAYDPAENHPWENGPIQQAAVDAAEISARQRLEEARRIEMRRKEILGAHADDILGLFQLVLSVTSLPGIRRAQARVEDLRGRLLHEVYNGPIKAEELPEQPQLGDPGPELPPDLRTPEAQAEIEEMLVASRALNTPPVTPEMDLRRMLAEWAARDAARAEVEARPMEPLPDWASMYPDMPAECEAARQADALVRDRERDRELDLAMERALPRWDTDPPDVPPPLTEAQAAVLARYLGEPRKGPPNLVSRTLDAFREITGRAGPLKVDQVTGQTR